MNTKELLKIKQLADAGSASDQYTYARANYWGQHIAKNHDDACEYYCLSAKQGYALAIKGIKRMAEDGHKLAIECQNSL